MSSPPPGKYRPVPSARRATPALPSAADNRGAAAALAIDLSLDSAIEMAIDSVQEQAGSRSRRTPDSSEDDSLLEALLDTIRLQAGRRMESRGEIGRGGMGAVIELFDGLLQRPTAKKVLLDGVRGSPAVVRAFIREAQITGQLDHPNIVPVHDLGIDEQGRLFFTMKRVVGQTLEDLLLSDPEARVLDNERLCARLEIVVKVCDALAFAHSRGVLHCDIKPQNIMVGAYGQVYVMDWGFAQLLKGGARGRQVKDILPNLAEPRDRFVLGTPGYMAPEQARGEELDERADVFAVGALMHLILSGRPLYAAPTPVEAIRKAQRGDFARLEPQGGRYHLPGDLLRIVNRATAPERAQRYPSIEALQADLQHFLRGGAHFPARSVPAGTVILNEGDEGDEAFIIVSGECEVYTGSGASKVSLKVLGPGEVFGEMALLAGAPRAASVAAHSDCQLVVVDRRVLEQEVSSMKPWMGAFLRAFAARFRDLQSQRGRAAQQDPSAQPWWRKWW